MGQLSKLPILPRKLAALLGGLCQAIFGHDDCMIIFHCFTFYRSIAIKGISEGHNKKSAITVLAW